MLNLLPVDEKKRLRKEYIMRLGIVVLSGFIVTLCIGIVLLLPAFFLSKGKKQTYLDQSLLTEESSGANEQEILKDVLRAAQRKMDILALGGDDTSLKTVFDTILLHRGSGIEITGILYTKSDEVVILTVSGVADTRGNLITFSRSLEDDSLFSDIELPVSNLAEDQDISFTITIQGDF